MTRANRSADVVVIGAGVMGTWTALTAARRGLDVVLVDQFGPGDVRATSGDESRIIRSSHGLERTYPMWSRESRDAWIELGEEDGSPIFEPCGAAWFAHRPDGFEADSEQTLRSLGIPVERLSRADAATRWPIRTDDLAFVLFEPEAGALRARHGVRAAARAFERLGGVVVRGRATADLPSADRRLEAILADGSAIAGGSFIFAAGPWLPGLFPATGARQISVTRQDVLYFGSAPGMRRFDAPDFPAWVDYDASFYGIPAMDGRGVKVAPDFYGPLADPDALDRVVEPRSIEVTRSFLRDRFPDLQDAPIVETRVCQYETTPDTHFLIDRHPDLENVWLVGGGSGHGFKHGPRIGRYVVDRLEGSTDPELDDRFSIDRARPPKPGMRSAAGVVPATLIASDDPAVEEPSRA